MRFGIRKLLAMVAVYAVFLGFTRPLGFGSMWPGICGATAVAAAIMLARRSDVRSILYVVTGALMGLFVGVSCLDDVILSREYGYDHGFGETAASLMKGGIIGIFIGGIVGSGIAHGRKREQ